VCLGQVMGQMCMGDHVVVAGGGLGQSAQVVVDIVVEVQLSRRHGMLMEERSDLLEEGPRSYI
jgi:hypothetical protein